MKPATRAAAIDRTTLLTVALSCDLDIAVCYGFNPLYISDAGALEKASKM
jgi:hypothetical protein